MKTKQSVIIICMLLNFSGISQEKIEATISTKTMSLGEQTAFSVIVPEAESKMVENQWKKFINDRSFFEFLSKGIFNTVQKVWIGISNIFSSEKKTFGKNSLKVEKKGDELVVKNVIHGEITNEHVDVYARISQSETGVSLSSFFRYSDSVFINETNVDQDVITSLQSYIREFGVDTYRKVVEGQIADEEKILKNMEHELKKLENKNSDYHKTIGDYESDIEEYNNSIWMENNDIMNIETQLNDLRVSQRNYNRKSPEYETFKKEMDEKTKDRKKGYREIKRQKAKIKRAESKIRYTKSDILINEREQDTQMEIIERQKSRINEFENKLLNII